MNGSFSNRWISVERIQIHEKSHEMGGLKNGPQSRIKA
jgi:hypothetical protein